MKIGLFGLLFVVLLTLKLSGVAAISWWIVFLPLIPSILLWGAVAGIFGYMWRVVTKL